MELTPIFKPAVKPARPGVYATHAPTKGRFSMWTGKFWRPEQTSVDGAADGIGFGASKAAYQSKPWQGLASEPTA